MIKHNILKNKYFLYATEFFAGMSVMAVELGASRLLAPYFSSSQIVWTVIIGTIMIALAIGNFWGGKAADKNPDPAKLYNRLLIAAIWIALIPFVGKYVIAGVSFLVALAVDNNFLIWASLLCCFVIFVFPLVLLGTVTPSLIKYTVDDLETNGAIVGRLGALNTIGSIIGTFLPTFVIIPAFGTALCFVIFSVVLALLAIIFFLSAGHFKIKGAVALTLALVLCFFSGSYSFAFGDKSIIHEDESIYNYLQVRETDTSLILATNVAVGVQSIKMKNAELTGMYYDYALAAPFMAGLNQMEQSKVLVLGLGTGTFAYMCDKFFPKTEITGVEIDAKIAALAKSYFALPENVTVKVADGRAYLAEAEKYEVIMVDTYQDITIPFQLSTVEFFTLVKEHLQDKGVMVVNLNMTSADNNSINDYLCDTVKAVFPFVYQVRVSNGTNTELFAFSDELCLQQFTANYKEFCRQTGNENLLKLMQTVENDLQPIDDGDLLLTDDKAPVELLGIRVIDELIQQEMQAVKELVRNKKWSELLGLLG